MIDKEKALVRLSEMVVSCYGLIFKKDKMKNSNTSVFAKGILGGALLGGPLGMAVAAANVFSREEKTTQLEQQINQTIKNIINISMLIYPELSPYDATNLAVTETSLKLGEKLIFDANVLRVTARELLDSKVLVSEACNTVRPYIETYFEKNSEVKKLARHN